MEIDSKAMDEVFRVWDDHPEVRDLFRDTCNVMLAAGAWVATDMRKMLDVRKQKGRPIPCDKVLMRYADIRLREIMHRWNALWSHYHAKS